VTVAAADATAAPSGTIGINFVGTSPTPMAAIESAGVLTTTHWNNATGAARSTPLALTDGSGAVTGATVTWAADGLWTLPTADHAGNQRLMLGYLDSSATATTVTVAGLPQHAYDVYVYADGDNRGNSRSGSYAISGPGITTTTTTLTDAPNTNFASGFTRAADGNGNYVRFTISGTGFTITATPGAASTATQRAPVNAVEIVPVSAPAAPAAIGINFVGTAATAMAATETAGVVNQSHWNNATGASRTTPLALVSAAGAATPATITWSASGIWKTPAADQAGNRRMMLGYLDSTSTSTTTVAVAGLAQAAYDVYVYADGDNRSYARTASYTISGAGIATAAAALTDAANATFSGTFVRASGGSGNYVKFTITGGAFTIAATPAAGGNATMRAPINAIQIVPQ
jgi:hypothetical protein